MKNRQFILVALLTATFCTMTNNADAQQWDGSYAIDAAAQQNAYAGRGGSGDNFWSSRFGAGNSDQGGSRGYVSVPGHGPIGYGF